MNIKAVQIKRNFYLLTFLLLLFELILPNFMVRSKEVIMLRKELEIICATNDPNSAIFLDPPTKDDRQPQSMIMDNNKTNWTSYGWQSNNSIQYLLSAVTDKRWEDFKTNLSNYNLFQPFQSVSVSLYSAGIVKFFLDNDDSFHPHERHLQTNSWNHYTVYFKNEDIYILENNELIHKTEGFIPNKVVIKTDNYAYLKVHDYHIKVAEEISTKPTKISHFNSCVMLYANLCAHCALQIKANGTPNTTLYGKQLNGQLNLWQNIRISSGTELELNRTTVNNSTQGFWAIEFRNCYVFKQIVESESILNEKSCQVLTLNQSTDQKNGPDSCEDVFHDQKQLCEEYQLCEYNFSNCSSKNNNLAKMVDKVDENNGKMGLSLGTTLSSFNFFVFLYSLLIILIMSG